MLKMINRTQSLVLAIPAITMLLASHSVSAEIYKWRDHFGRIQYSDRPPVAGLVKATRNEIVNALQKKELCALPTANIEKNVVVASTRNYSANFFGGSFKKLFATPNTNLTNFTNPKNALSAATNNVTPRYTPLKPSSVFASGGLNVNVFGAPIKPQQIAAVTPKSTIGSNGLPSTVAVLPKPVILPTNPAPTPVVASPTTPPKPLQVATAAPNSSPNIVQKELMPAVDISQNITPVVGYSDLRIRAATANANDQPRVGDSNGAIGAFRIVCKPSHMSNDDPIVYPNQQGAAHHHTFFGNTEANFKTNLDNITMTGNSTCAGGIANRSAYWIPSMIDTKTNTPMIPTDSIWYYKTGYGGVPTSKITIPPKGLKIITGSMKANSASTSKGTYECFYKNGGWSATSANIPDCAQGDKIVSHVGFPQCWDGKNLDSPDHKSHMSDTIAGSCPATHPIAIPSISLNIHYIVTTPDGTKNWRLSSDNYAKNGSNAGYSSHADWVNGWDEKVLSVIVKKCINAGMDCHAFLLGDGRTLYGDS